MLLVQVQEWGGAAALFSRRLVIFNNASSFFEELEAIIDVVNVVPHLRPDFVVSDVIVSAVR